MKPKSPTFFVLLSLAGIAILVLAVIAVRSLLFKTGEIVILNANPYPVVHAVKYQTSAGSWHTIGWFPLSPGEQKTVTAVFYYNVTPQFFVAAESNDAELLKWLSETNDGVVYFSNDEPGTSSGQLPKNRAISLQAENDTSAELEEIEFSPVQTDEKLYLLTDPLFHDAILRNNGAEIPSEKEGYDLIRDKAFSLYESLLRQKQFEESFKQPSDYPFAFEFNMSDEEQGFMFLGVKLESVIAQTLHGDEIKLQNGDILVGIKSGENDPVTPVYAPADAYLVLHEHAIDTENGGITKPLRYLVVRNEELIEVESFFLFNPSYGWEDKSEGEAFIDGMLNSLTLGYYAEIVGAFSKDPHATWNKTQKLWRQKQFFPKAANAGDMAGFLIPTPTKILKIGKWIRGGRVLSASRVAMRGLGVELTRLAVYTYKTHVPWTHKRNMTAEEVKKCFPSGVSLRLAPGALKDKKKQPKFKVRQQTLGRTR